RENRAANSESKELTVIGASQSIGDGNGNSVPIVTVTPHSFPRVSVSISGTKESKKRLVVIATAIAAVLLIATTLAVRSRLARPTTDAVVAATPSPTVEPTPTPSPSPIPSPKETKPAVKPKKESKARSLMNKVKRILTKPF